ncbi:YciI family protein [Devosia sp. XJ19-1]|uniref:YciI family protein n=1 Tax=Devosia ureilytica TaxID=2952754 RepID=A0A9Q4AME3_9HYPH|nr:YciI family protein [Devosia ureilytica]MCP8883356.1 YciI family protein [Devosia ureilytica]MCP8886276.1 YciI family protein [Devosia ureilytica]
MFVVLLKPSGQPGRAGDLLAGHKAWLEKGLADGVFALWGSLKPEGGGAIMAHGLDRAALEKRVAADPFVSGGVVRAEIVEIAPARAESRLEFLLD